MVPLIASPLTATANAQTEFVQVDVFGYEHVYRNLAVYDVQIAVGVMLNVTQVAEASTNIPSGSYTGLVAIASALSVQDENQVIEIGIVKGYTMIGTFQEPQGFIAVWDHNPLNSSDPLRKIILLSEAPEYVELYVMENGALFAYVDFNYDHATYITLLTKKATYQFIISPIEEIWWRGS